MNILKMGKCPTTNKDLVMTLFKASPVETLEKVDTSGVTFLKNNDAGENVGVIAGWASTFDNHDTAGDVIRKGAFTKSLTERDPKIFWAHNPAEPIGRILKAFETDYGLWVEIGLNLDVQRGREVYSLYKQGAIDGMSIGAILEKYEIKKGRGGESYLDVKEMRLYEISAVSLPANEKALVDTIKSVADAALEAATDELKEDIQSAETVDDLLKMLTDMKNAEDEMYLEIIKKFEAEKKAEEEFFENFLNNLSE